MGAARFSKFMARISPATALKSLSQKLKAIFPRRQPTPGKEGLIATELLSEKYQPNWNTSTLTLDSLNTPSTTVIGSPTEPHLPVYSEAPLYPRSTTNLASHPNHLYELEPVPSSDLALDFAQWMAEEPADRSSTIRTSSDPSILALSISPLSSVDSIFLEQTYYTVFGNTPSIALGLDAALYITDALESDRANPALSTDSSQRATPALLSDSKYGEKEYADGDLMAQTEGRVNIDGHDDPCAGIASDDRCRHSLQQHVMVWQECARQFIQSVPFAVGKCDAPPPSSDSANLKYHWHALPEQTGNESMVFSWLRERTYTHLAPCQPARSCLRVRSKSIRQNRIGDHRPVASRSVHWKSTSETKYYCAPNHQ
ncbi:hypothetical protein H4R33_001006 [Dimargaris cristalligena]|uniref:Uncharacterized protein n=1 Tax=Dimargaris cristalligena TaxID=215637 RepID=A0A4P9ZTF2_9FUNG|nr:hypothetical protein H4R33_001006 [Dimargaris cristalligena]RKP36757.1 hypothetical protein BJ085DRAFT_31012 [Dimargaris cristalligena]|eukprot:RKP36757.1 hypothetical protein BJ085DRAFT_31012 [Dimargaris cristalligena]